MPFCRFKTFRYLLLLTLIFLLFINNLALASTTFYESFAGIINSNIVKIAGYIAGGQFGATVSSGDYNGDNIDDLVVSAPFASLNDKEWNGAVFIILGQRYYDQDVIDLSLISPNIKIIGANSLDQLGTSLTSGDFNNDGFDDIAIGAYNAYQNDIRTGKVYVFYGKAILDSRTVDLAVDKSYFELAGEHSNDGFGLSLNTLDINNDNVDDLLIGAPFASISEFTNSGAVYGYFGSSNGLASLYNILFYGESAMERFGSSISGGDINADGQNDVIIGAYFSNNDSLTQAGKVYVYTDVYSAIVSDPSFTIAGTQNNEWFGFAIDVGDINGDYIDEIGITSFPFNGDKGDAKVSVFYGNQLFDTVADSTIDSSILNSSSELLLGASLLIENFDTIDDTAEILIGAPGILFPSSNEAGKAYIVYDNLSEQNIVSSITGENPDDWFGYSADVLDFNGDLYQDLAISSRYFDTENAVNNGKVYVFLGSDDNFGYKKEISDNNLKNYVERGELISIIIDKFDLKNKKANLINECYEYKDFCFFNFLAMSSYEGIVLEPDVLLYPDIGIDYKYYEDITIGTMLGLINGYLSEDNSPFHPELPISRIQALKIILGAADLVPPKYRFELINILGSLDKLQTQPSYFSDVDARISYMWWYPRYVNFALESGIIDRGEFFRPDESITKQELDDIINRTLEFISLEQNEEVNP